MHGLPYETAWPLAGLSNTGESTGLLLKFMVPPTCVNLTISFQTDLYGSLGRLMKRFETSLLPYTFSVFLLLFMLQFISWNEKGKPLFWPSGIFPSFLHVYKYFVAKLYPLWTVTLVLFVVMFKTSLYSNEQSYGVVIDSIYEWHRVFLPVLLLLLATGLAGIIWAVIRSLTLVVSVIYTAASFFRRKMKSNDR